MPFPWMSRTSRCPAAAASRRYSSTTERTSSGRNEWRSKESSIGTWFTAASRFDSHLDRHRSARGLGDDAVLLGEGDRLLDLAAARVEERGRHAGVNDSAFEPESAGGVFLELAFDSQRRLGITQRQLLQEDRPGVDEARR